MAVPRLMNSNELQTISEQKECEEWDEWDKHVSLNPENENSKPALDNFSCFHLTENPAAVSNIYQHGCKTEDWMYGEVKNEGTCISIAVHWCFYGCFVLICV